MACSTVIARPAVHADAIQRTADVLRQFLLRQVERPAPPAHPRAKRGVIVHAAFLPISIIVRVGRVMNRASPGLMRLVTTAGHRAEEQRADVSPPPDQERLTLGACRTEATAMEQ